MFLFQKFISLLPPMTTVKAISLIGIAIGSMLVFLIIYFRILGTVTANVIETGEKIPVSEYGYGVSRGVVPMIVLAYFVLRGLNKVLSWGLSTVALIGLAVAAVVVLLLMLIALACRITQDKRNRLPKDEVNQQCNKIVLSVMTVISGLALTFILYVFEVV